jgi:hypothetical protein
MYCIENSEGDITTSSNKWSGPYCFVFTSGWEARTGVDESSESESSYEEFVGCEVI